MGRKRSTIYRTLTTPIVMPVGSVVNLPSNNYTTRTIYYSGNLKIDNTPSNGTIFVLNTSDGYFQTDDLAGYRHHCYYVRDHLGNVCAVWDSYASSFTQTTFYYPSGVPMSISTNQAVQPNKYNGKPYEEMHGMDVYEYEFRNYYATIMRFTAMDPLCEQTPWQSPYVYAANNPICNIDWMGLDGEAYSTNDQSAINSLFDCLSGGGILDEYDAEDNGWTNVSEEVIWEENTFDFIFYYSLANAIPGAEPTLYTPGDAAIVEVVGGSIKVTKDNATSTTDLNNLQTIINVFSTGIGGWELSQRNPANWVGKNGVRYPTSLLRGKGSYVYNRSYTIKGTKIKQSPLHKINQRLGYISLTLDAVDVYNNGLRLGTMINAGVTLFGMYGGPWGTLFVGVYTITDIGVDFITGESITERLNNIVIL